MRRSTPSEGRVEVNDRRFNGQRRRRDRNGVAGSPTSGRSSARRRASLLARCKDLPTDSDHAVPGELNNVPRRTCKRLRARRPSALLPTIITHLQTSLMTAHAAKRHLTELPDASGSWTSAPLRPSPPTTTGQTSSRRAACVLGLDMHLDDHLTDPSLNSPGVGRQRRPCLKSLAYAAARRTIEGLCDKFEARLP